MRIGIIGGGLMGLALAERLGSTGHRVTVWNRDAAKAAELVAAGARPAATPRAAAEGAEVVVTMVTDSAAVENVILGQDGAIHGAMAGTVVVDMSTIHPEVARNVGRVLRERGIGFLDSPVTGMEFRARDGTLSLLVGGEQADLEKVRDVLSVLGSRITWFGPQGCGQIAKAFVVLRAGFSPSPELTRVLQEHVKRPLAEELLFGKLAGGGHVLVRLAPGGDSLVLDIRPVNSPELLGQE